MTEKELRKLSREDLLRLLLAQSREVSRQKGELGTLKEDKAQLEESLERLKAKLDDKDAQIERLKTRLDDKDAKLSEQRLELDELRAELSERPEPSAEAQVEADAALREENAALQEEIAGFQDEITALQEENTTLREESSGLREEITGLQEANTALQEENDSLREENDGLHQLLEKQSARIEELDRAEIESAQHDEGTEEPVNDPTGLEQGDSQNLFALLEAFDEERQAAQEQIELRDRQLEILCQEIARQEDLGQALKDQQQLIRSLDDRLRLLDGRLEQRMHDSSRSGERRRGFLSRD